MATEKSFGDANYSRETVKLIRAVLDNEIYAARKAIANGANVKVRGRNNNTLLHVCLSKAMGAVLLNNDANINARNAFNQIPLHTSMRRGLVGLSELFLDQGADVNAQELDGTAPLHLAQNPNINRTLLDKGANPNLQNNVGDTPLQVAVREKGNPIVDELLSRGADKSIENAAGKDAADEWRQRARRAIRELAAMRQILGIVEAPHNTPLTAPVETASNSKTMSKTTSTVSMLHTYKTKLTSDPDTTNSRTSHTRLKR